MSHPELASPPVSPAAKPLGKGRRMVRRALLGGSPTDRGRVPRYVWMFALGLAAIWMPISGYLKTAKPVYASDMSLILPGSGAASSVNLAEIGQASSHSSSAFSNNSVSPTETYKRLLAADRVLRAAADHVGVDAKAFGKPQVRLVDQTAFIHVKMVGPDPGAAQSRNAALLKAFFSEIDRLRNDEMDSRQTGGLDAIDEYRDSVARTRVEIEALRKIAGLHSVQQYDRQLDELDALRARIDTAAAAYERQLATVRRLEMRLGADAQMTADILRLNADTDYVALIDTMAQATSNLSLARSSYGEHHPKVIKARTARDAARAKAEARAISLTGEASALERSIDGGRGALLTELVREEAIRQGVFAELEEMRALASTQSARLSELAPLAARLEDLQRDFNVAEAVFASAIARSQSSKADVFASYPLVQVLEDPTLPDGPTSPRKKLAFAAGGAATVLLLIALSLGWIRRALIERLILEKGTRR